MFLSKLKGDVRPDDNYYKSVHQSIPTHENREHRGNFQKKQVSSVFN